MIGSSFSLEDVAFFCLIVRCGLKVMSSVMALEETTTWSWLSKIVVCACFVFFEQRRFRRLTNFCSCVFCESCARVFSFHVVSPARSVRSTICSIQSQAGVFDF